MSEITNYSFPVMYSPTSLDTMSIILTDMDGLSADSHMRIWRVDVNAEDGTFVCLMAKETDNAWRLYNTYEEVNARFNELHPVAIDDSSVFSTDREAFTEKPEVFTAEEKRAWLDQMQGVTLGSDAFFPFSDNIERARKSGVAYIAQPGGSVRDEDVIATCNKYNMAMVFTGIRLFHH